ncbi:alcohol acyltransferase 9-like [Musa acuminata AAA Group]|uniref:alcohol acyltransferase 9-like n=1 Tax=Musa acuminata AAA Group TaxID=214697 RepID=UPI0031E43892
MTHLPFSPLLLKPFFTYKCHPLLLPISHRSLSHLPYLSYSLLFPIPLSLCAAIILVGEACSVTQVQAMTKSIEIPDCYYPKEPSLVCPSSSTPRHTLYLSNLDDQKFLRFSIKYLYVYKKAVGWEALRTSLSKVLVDYYPLAGRVTTSAEDGEKLEVDCNGEGALLAEGYVDLTVEKFLEGSRRPNRSWRKLLYKVEAQSFVAVPPLIVQMTHLSCGGMILCTAINHCLCDGIGTAQFLHAWALITSKSNANLPTNPFHGRHILKPRDPPQIAFSHPEFSRPLPRVGPDSDYITQILLSQPLVPVSLTFTTSHILHLKQQCVPSLKCTSFEVLASHVWRAWIKSLDPPASLHIKLLFSMNMRQRLKPELPSGYYGNGFVLACAETSVEELIASNPHYSVKLVQEAKERLNDDYVRSMIDLLDVRKVKPELSSSLVISPWTKLGLEDLDFGEGRPLHMGPLASEIYCLFLPVIGDLQAFTVLMSIPQAVADRFQHYCTKDLDDEEENGIKEDGGRGYA